MTKNILFVVQSIYRIKLIKSRRRRVINEKIMESEESSKEVKEFNDKMWLERNNNMSQQVKNYLADTDKKTYFVVVGAGHVNGTTGILNQLKDNYKIEQIK